MDFDKFVAVGKEVTVTRKDGVTDVISLKPLRFKDSKVLYKLFSMLKKSGSSDIEDVIDEEFMSAVMDVCKRSLRTSYPDASDDVLDMFVTLYSHQLLPAIIELNSPGDTNGPASKSPEPDEQEA